MILAIMSDLHFENDQDKGRSFIDSLDSTGVDVLVLAGDIIATTNYFTMLGIYRQLCDKYPNVVMVSGNHEFYGNSVYRKENQLMRLNNEIGNLHWLDSTEVTINEQRFLGGTMWFSKDPGAQLYEKYMGDFGYIDNFVPWVYRKNKVFEEFLKENLKSTDIVVTHHLPSERCVASQFKGDPLNPFFLNDIEWLIKERQPKVFISGHTHSAFNFMLDKTQMICNPRGYTNERKASAFNKDMKITI